MGKEISDASIQAIARSCSELVHIDIDDSLVTDETAQMLARLCSKLEFVSIGGTALSDIGVVALAERCKTARLARGLHSESFTGPNLCLS